MVAIASRLTRRAAVIGAGIFALAAAVAQAAQPDAFQAYSAAGFKAALNGSKPVLVHVHASWCPVCTRQADVLARIDGGAALKSVAPIRVDFDADTEFRSQFGVRQQSVLIVFKGGKEVARAGGITSDAAIGEFLKTALAK